MEPALRDHLLNNALKDSMNMLITSYTPGISRKAACQPCGEAGEKTMYFT